MEQNIATTKMTSRGQIVIPETIRKQLGLETGAQFVVIGQGDVVMLKVINPPSPGEFAELKRKLRRQAQKAGLKEKDIKSAIAKARCRT
ncbi:MAG: hypothetical protein FJ088_15095 [Deltaproteobacteria bacterium]|nr:hypothetical protein [Deltaproteobacteria bacterium]